MVRQLAISANQRTTMSCQKSKAKARLIKLGPNSGNLVGAADLAAFDTNRVQI